MSSQKYAEEVTLLVSLLRNKPKNAAENIVKVEEKPKQINGDRVKQYLEIFQNGQLVKLEDLLSRNDFFIKFRYQ